MLRHIVFEKLSRVTIIISEETPTPGSKKDAFLEKILSLEPIETKGDIVETVREERDKLDADRTKNMPNKWAEMIDEIKGLKASGDTWDYIMECSKEIRDNAAFRHDLVEYADGRGPSLQPPDNSTESAGGLFAE